MHESLLPQPEERGPVCGRWPKPSHLCSHPQPWGLQMIYKSVKLPALKVCKMLLETPRGRVQAKKWSRVPFLVPDFDYLQHCAQNLADLSLD